MGNDRHPILERFLAAITVLALAAVSLPGPVAIEGAGVRGRIVTTDGGEPIAGARLHAGHRSSGKAFTSAATDGDGRVTLAELPPGSYDFAVELDGGLYPVPSPVRLGLGKTRALRFSLDPNRKTGAGRGTAKVKKPSTLDNPGTALLLVFGFAFLYGGVDEVLDDDDDPPPAVASPSLLID